MTQLASLVVSLGLKSASFVRGLADAKVAANRESRAIQGHLDKIKGSTSGVTASLKTMVAGFAAGFAIQGLAAAVSGGLEYASSLKEVAQQLGVTTDTLQEYRYAATQVGITQEEMDAGLAKLTRSLGMAAAGSKAQAAAFAELGVTAKTADGAMPQLIAGLSKIADPAKRAALEVTIFGKAGQKLDTLLAGGTGEVDRLRDAAHRLGIVLSEEQIQKADDTADKLAELKTVMKANISAAVADNVDSIMSLVNALATFIQWTGKAISSAREWKRSLGQKIDAGKGWTVTGGEVAGPDGKAARTRWYATEMGNAESKSKPSYLRETLLDGGSLKKYRNQQKPEAPVDYAAAARGGGAGTGRKRGGGGGSAKRVKSSGPTLAEQLATIRDGLFPDEAERRELEEKLATIGKGLAAKILSPADYERQKTEINKKIAEIGNNSDELKKQGQAILDALFPEEAQRRDLEAKAKTLGDNMRAGLLPVADYERGVAAINGQLADLTAKPWKDVLDRYAPEIGQRNQILADIASITDRMTKGLGDQGQNTAALKGATDRLKELDDQSKRTKISVADLATGITNSLGQLANSIKSGDWLSALSGVLDLLLQLGDAGVLGKKIQTSVRAPVDGRRAGGGPVTRGLRYLVGERGPELFEPTSSGRIVSHSAMRREAANDTGLRIVTEPSPLFHQYVLDRAGRVVQQSAPGIAGMGAGMAQRALARQNDRRLA